MRNPTTVRHSIALVAAALLMGLAAPAASQTLSDEEREEATTKEDREKATSRIEEQTKRLDQDREGQEVETGPGLSREEAQGEGMSPQEIERIKRRLEQKNREMIGKLDRLIENDPYNPSKPEWMFQKAELMWELRNMEYMRKRDEYNQCLVASDKGTVEESECTEPEPDYGEAQQIYKKILTQYPDYNRLDQVIFRLGKGLIEAGKDAQAVSYLQRLIKNYPNSKFIPNANLSLAEFFFKKEMLQSARDYYKKVLTYKNDPNFDYALYKLGWVYYNLNKFDNSVDTFKRVVERTEDKLGFQNQALNDLVVAYSEIPDGWIKLRDYLLERRDKKFVYDKLTKMAGLYESQGKDQAAVEVYSYFIEERPNHKKIPSWMESVIIAKKKINDFEDLEKTINRYANYLREGGTWWTQNKANKNHLNNATLLKQSTLAFLATTYHKRAQEKDKSEDIAKQSEEVTGWYKAAVSYYQEYVDRFPKDTTSFDMNFYLAEIQLLDLGDYEKAAERYGNVVGLYNEGITPKGVKKKELKGIVQDAAYGRVMAYDELVKKHHEDSILVKMAQFQEQHGDKVLAEEKQTKGPPSEKEPNKKEALLEYEKGFVKASDQYAEMFPNTDITPTVDFIAAEVYKARGHYAECIDRYESIINNAPKHRYASFAGNSLLEANYVLENWDEVEKWARYLIEKKIFDVTPKDKLQSAIAYAINSRAQELDKNGKSLKAADELLRLYNEFPDSELAPGALFNAAAFYERADQVKKAVKHYEQVVNKYPKDVKAPEALFVLGAIAEARANFGKAADYFARLGSDKTYVIKKDDAEGEDSDGIEKSYSDHPQAADAVFNAANLREAMENWDESIATYEKYIEMFPGRDDIRDVRLKLGFLEKKRDNKDKALERFDKFLDRDDIKPEEKVELHTQIGLLIEDTQPRRWEKESDEHFTKAVETWKNMEDEAKKSGMRHSASHARFRQAERLYNEFRDQDVSFPMSKLQKTLGEKAEKQQEAEKAYFEIIQMKSPRWASAASFRIGDMYSKFYQKLRDLPLPEGLSERQKMEYRFALDDRIAPLQEKAVKAFTNARNIALDLKAYNVWSEKSAAKVAELRQAQFPITGQKGVDADHGRIKLYTPNPVTEFDTFVERARARKARQPAEPEPPAEGEGAEGAEGEGAEQPAGPESDGSEQGGDASPDAKGDSPEDSQGEGAANQDGES